MVRATESRKLSATSEAQPAGMFGRFTTAVALLALAAPAAAQPAPPPCPAADAIPSAASLDRSRAALLCEVNRHRQAHGLQPLRVDRRLARAAQRHAADMARRGYFGHRSQDGRQPGQRLRAAGWRRGWSELLASGCGGASTAGDAARGWLDSPPHRRSLLSASYRYVGPGLAIRTRSSSCLPEAYWTLELGS